MAKETIKDRVLQTAQKDPFLTIEEIAQSVNTTPRYVRTILSEAKVSLMHLRKVYAKSMEKRLKPDQQVPETSPRSLKNIEPQLKVSRIRDEKIAMVLSLEPDTELLQVSQLQFKDERGIFVQLTTYKDLNLVPQPNSLRQMLLFDPQTEKLTQGESWIEVVPGEPALNELLEATPEMPLIKIHTLLYLENEVTAVETRWVSSEGILIKSEKGVGDDDITFVSG